MMAQNAGKISITMSVQIHKDLITDSDVSALIDYCENEPGLPRDERPDVTNLDLQIDNYRSQILKIIKNSCRPYTYICGHFR